MHSIARLALISALIGSLYCCSSESGTSGIAEPINVSEGSTTESTVESLIASPSGTTRQIEIGRDYSGPIDVVSPLIDRDINSSETYAYSLTGRLLTCSEIAENYSNLVDGMSEQEVIDVIGLPLHIRGTDWGFRIYEYGRVNSMRSLRPVRFNFDNDTLTYSTVLSTPYDPPPVKISCTSAEPIDFSANYARQSPPTCSQLQERLSIYPFISMPEDYLLRYIGKPSRLSIAGTYTDYIYYTYDYTAEVLLGTRWVEKARTVTFAYEYPSGKPTEVFYELNALLSYPTMPEIRCKV